MQEDDAGHAERNNKEDAILQGGTTRVGTSCNLYTAPHNAQNQHSAPTMHRTSTQLPTMHRTSTQLPTMHGTSTQMLENTQLIPPPRNRRDVPHL